MHNPALRSLWLTVTSILTMMLAGACRAQLANPGFEEGGSGTVASNWTQFGNAFRDHTLPHSASFDLKLFGNFSGGTNVTGAYQYRKIAVGQRFVASVWAINRAADAMAGNNFALLKLVYRDSSNNDLQSVESARITAATTRDEFQLLTASLGPAPFGTHHCAIFLLFVQPDTTPFASGSTLFDDVSTQVTSGMAETPVWSDDFNGSTLNPADWEIMLGDGTTYGLPSGWGNDELQYYTARPENLVVSGGMLHIIARRENYGGRAYTSARIRTKGKHDFQYGRFEARMKVPAGKGLWPAFWMMPTTPKYGAWAASGEIDILECINDATAAYGTIHYGGPFPANVHTTGSATQAASFANDFHVYALEWEPDAIRWYVDGTLYYSRSSLDWYSTAQPWNERAPFDDPFHFLLNLAVGGNWPGAPDNTTIFPAELLVDWVRAQRWTTFKSPTKRGGP